jgi:acylpyruvate hydrolase
MKIFCIGRNYIDHIHELNNEKPTEPIIFMKPKSALSRPNFPIKYPDFTEDLHYEAEVVIRINKNGKNIPIHEAHQYYNEWSLGIDFTARDIQNQLKSKGLPWEKAKAFDNSAFVGNFAPIPQNKYDVNFQLYINNELKQDGNTKDMMFKFDEIITHISKYFSIQIGDLIFTGTPAGVGILLPYDELRGVLNGQEVFNTIIK